MSLIVFDALDRGKNGFWKMVKDEWVWIKLPPLSEGYPTVEEWEEWLSKCRHKKSSEVTK